MWEIVSRCKIGLTKILLAYKISKRKTVDILQSLLSTNCSFQQKCKGEKF
ncbi:hypothetical protein Hanom_Chr11g01030971 [Helianthus anomalus]